MQILPEVKKLVRWHDALVVFVTKQARSVGWNHRTMVKVSVSADGNRIVIEKALQL